MAYSSEVLADAPLAYWRMGESSGTTLVDASGNAHNGAYTAPTLGRPSLLYGDSDTAVRLGSGSYASVPAAAWQAPTRLTVEAWVNLDNATGGTGSTIASLDNVAEVATNRSWNLRAVNGHVDAWVFIGTTLCQITSAGPISSGTTYHVVLTHDGTTLRLYINGAFDSSVAASGAVNVPTYGIEIGRNAGGGEPAPGVVDEVAVYGSALSQARVAAHYAAGSPPTTTAPLGPYPTAVLADAPLAYYRLGEASGTVLVDASGNAHGGLYSPAPTHGTGLLVGDADTSVDFPSAGVASVPSAAWMNASTLTVEALIRPTNVSSYHFIASREFNGTAGSFWLAVLDGKINALVHPSTGGTVQFSSTAAIAANTTYHVALTVDATTARLYINGAPDSTAAAAGVNVSSSNNLRIGQWEGGLPFTGKIDEVAYYGTALPAARIAAHYTAATVLPAPTGTLAATLPPFGTALVGTSTPPATTGTVAATLPPFGAILAGTSLTPGTTTGALAATLPTFSATLAGTSTPPPAIATLAATLAPFAAALQGNTPTVGDKLTAVLPAFTISLQAANRITATDTTYTNDSYTYGGTAQVDYAPPVAPPPPGLVRRDVRRVHQSLPTPTLVKGRPQ